MKKSYLIFLCGILIFSPLFTACKKKKVKTPKHEYLTITGTNVNFRNEANLQSVKLGQFVENEQVIFLEKSPKKQKIGKYNNYWYKVRRLDKKEGWVYGAFVERVKKKINDVISPEDMGTMQNGNYWEQHSGSDIPGKMLMKCNSKPFGRKSELLDTPKEQRYECTEYIFTGKEYKYLGTPGFYIKRLPVSVGHNLSVDDMADLFWKHSDVEKVQEVLELTEESEVPDFSLVPLFISADFLLHSYHLIFQRMVEEIEVRKFYPIIKKLTGTLLKDSLEAFNATSDPRLKKVWENISIFFAVPAMEMDLQIREKDISSKAETAARKIRKAAGSATLSITGKREDFSQYKPRGHYNKSKILRKYFKVMMWYGRIYFPEKKPVEGMLITELLGRKDNMKQWENLYIPTTYIVGKSDDLGVYEYRKAIESVFGKEYTATSYPPEEKLTKMKKLLSKMSKPKIVSNSVRTGKENNLNPEEKHSGFRFMGQRFIPDSYIFTKLTSPRVGTDARPRNIPKGLDVMALLGSGTAKKLLSSDFMKIKKYKHNYNMLKSKFKGYDRKKFSETIYWSWLDSFRTLFLKPSKKLPSFVHTPAWQYRILLAAHGSWAELRHDTLLYAKQSAAEMGGGGDPKTIYYGGQPRIPRGYVEPSEKFFKRMSLLVSQTREMMEKADVLTDEYRRKLTDFNEVIDKLHAIARKQEEDDTISDEEYLYIAKCSGIIKRMLLPENLSYGGIIDNTFKQMALVADVHTDFFGKQVLEVAVGRPMEIAVFVKDQNGPRVCIGYVYSYYEFTQPMNSRMTDEEWKNKVYSGNNEKYLKKREPSWIQKLPIVR